MPVLKLTKSRIDKINHPEKGQVFYFDADLRGFGLCVGKKAKAYFAQREVNGRTIRTTIGRHGEFTAEQARKKAQELLYRMANGENPNTTKRLLRKRVTLVEAFESYLENRKELSPKTIYDYRRAIELYLKDWQRKPLQEITKNMVMERHSKLGDKHGQSTANGTMRVLRAVFNYSCVVFEDIVKENPVKRLSQSRSWYRQERRRSIISPSELKPWYEGVMNLESEVTKDYLRFLLFTGMRRAEATRLKWEDVDFIAKTVLIPETKNREPLALPMSDFLMDLLSARKEKTNGSEFVFPGSGRSGHLEEPKRAVSRVIALSGVKFMLHDLRRTFITIAESLDIPHYALKRLINHKISGDVTAGYIVMDIERLRKPMQRITDYILQEAGVKKKPKVVDIQERIITYNVSK